VDGSANTPPLPEPTETLVLPNGKVIAPNGHLLDPAVMGATVIENGKTAIALVSKMKRTLGDMPDIPRNMNPVACVIVYTQVGLDDEAIAECLNTTIENIKRLKESEIYSKLSELFEERVFDDEQRTARHIISKHSARAAQKIVDLVSSQSGDLALMASRDVLRIGGVDKSGEVKGLSSLKIVMVDKADAKQEITIEMEK
jgi:hypothetical protein